jgi:hypothetical protein
MNLFERKEYIIWPIIDQKNILLMLVTSQSPPKPAGQDPPPPGPHNFWLKAVGEKKIDNYRWRHLHFAKSQLNQ